MLHGSLHVLYSIDWKSIDLLSLMGVNSLQLTCHVELIISKFEAKDVRCATEFSKFNLFDLARLSHLWRENAWGWGNGFRSG